MEEVPFNFCFSTISLLSNPHPANFSKTPVLWQAAKDEFDAKNLVVNVQILCDEARNYSYVLEDLGNSFTLENLLKKDTSCLRIRALLIDRLESFGHASRYRMHHLPSTAISRDLLLNLMLPFIAAHTNFETTLTINWLSPEDFEFWKILAERSDAGNIKISRIGSNADMKALAKTFFKTSKFTKFTFEGSFPPSLKDNIVAAISKGTLRSFVQRKAYPKLYTSVGPTIFNAVFKRWIETEGMQKLSFSMPSAMTLEEFRMVMGQATEEVSSVVQLEFLESPTRSRVYNDKWMRFTWKMENGNTFVVEVYTYTNAKVCGIVEMRANNVKQRKNGFFIDYTLEVF